jgi:hypothetical protein
LQVGHHGGERVEELGLLGRHVGGEHGADLRVGGEEAGVEAVGEGLALSLDGAEAGGEQGHGGAVDGDVGQTLRVGSQWMPRKSHVLKSPGRGNGAAPC